MKIISGSVPRPQKVCVYGPEGVGKTSFAAKFPKPLFLDLERGSCAYEVDRVYADTCGEVEAVIETLARGGSGYETVVIDTADALCQLVGRQLAAAKGLRSVEDIPYGKSGTFVAEGISRFLIWIDALVGAGLHVVVLAHADMKKCEDAEAGATYDRHIFRLQKQSANKLMERMDAVLFANFDTRIIQDANGKARGVGGKERVLHTVRTASHDGKNRQGLPERMGLCSETVERLLAGSATSGTGVPRSHPWDDLVAGYSDEEIASFLVGNGYLLPGQDWREVSEAVEKRGLAHSDRLRAGLEAHSRGAEKP